MANAILTQTINEIALRADALRLVYFRANIDHIEDDGYTFVMLRDYIEPHMAATAYPTRRSALETYYIDPGAFSNPENCDDIQLRLVLERGYTDNEIIPYLNCVVRVVIRRAELFAIISANGEVVFADEAKYNTRQNIFHKYFKSKLS